MNFGETPSAANEKHIMMNVVKRKKICNGIYEMQTLEEEKAPDDVMEQHLQDMRSATNVVKSMADIIGSMNTTEAEELYSRNNMANITQFSYYQHVPGSLIDNLTLAKKIDVPNGWKLNALPGVLVGIAKVCFFLFLKMEFFV